HADEGTGCIKEQQMGLRFGSYPSTKLKNIELDFVFGSRFRLKLLTTESSTERTRNFVAVIALDSVFQQAARSQTGQSTLLQCAASHIRSSTKPCPIQVQVPLRSRPPD